MRRAFLNYFSTWEVVLIIAILFTLFTFIIFACLHRFFPKLLINSSTHNVAGVFNILGISSITLAFTIVILWQYYIAAEEAVNNEATSLNEIIMFSQALPQQERAAIKENVGNYAKIVINDEWDKMKQGEMSTKAEGAINMLYQIIVNYHPKNENERIFFQKILDKYDVILHARDLRHQAIDSITGYISMFVRGKAYRRAISYYNTRCINGWYHLRTYYLT